MKKRPMDEKSIKKIEYLQEKGWYAETLEPCVLLMGTEFRDIQMQAWQLAENIHPADRCILTLQRYAINSTPSGELARHLLEQVESFRAQQKILMNLIVG